MEEYCSNLVQVQDLMADEAASDCDVTRQERRIK